MSNKPVNYLSEAQRRIATDREIYDAPIYAAIAQAEALIRIAECLETIVDDMAQIRRTLEELTFYTQWKG